MKPKKLKAAIIMFAAALYVVSPLDLLPDIFPVIGWVDDLAIGICGVQNAVANWTGNLDKDGKKLSA